MNKYSRIPKAKPGPASRFDWSPPEIVKPTERSKLSTSNPDKGQEGPLCFLTLREPPPLPPPLVRGGLLPAELLLYGTFDVLVCQFQVVFAFQQLSPQRQGVVCIRRSTHSTSADRAVIEIRLQKRQITMFPFFVFLPRFCC